MKKSNIVKVFDNQTKLAAALGVTREAIYQWPEDLNQRQIDECVGAAIRLRKDIQLPNAILFYRDTFLSK